MKQEWYELSLQQVFKLAQSNEKKGLLQKEAKKRLASVGLNKLARRKQAGAVRIFVRQFNSIFVYILSVAAAISLFLSHWVDFSVIAIAVFFSSFLGFLI